jgi:opacity protein-like surface antigen
MQIRIIALAALSLGLAALPARAADNGIYLGGSIGQGGVQFDEAIEGFDFDYDASSTAFKLIAGWRFLDWLAVEANYVDLGSGDDTIEDTRIETDVSGVSGSVVGFLPVGPVDLFARGGLIYWDAEVNSNDIDLSGSEDGTDFAWGVGAQFRVWSLSLRAEYERFEIEDADTVDLISVGVTWTFL